jgi:hypothetical protein
MNNEKTTTLAKSGIDFINAKIKRFTPLARLNSSLLLTLNCIN